MNLIVVYKDGFVSTHSNVSSFKYISESNIRKSVGPYFYIELQSCDDVGSFIDHSLSICLSEVDSIEVFNV